LPAKKAIQVNSIDDELKNRLWNITKAFVFDKLKTHSQYSGETEFESFAKLLWHHHFKLAVDTIPEYDFQILSFIRTKFFESKWHITYDLIEFLANINYSEYHWNIDTYKYKQTCNSVMEDESAGYRFVGEVIAPLTNPEEVSDILNAINTSGSFSILKGVNIHLGSALEKISDKSKRDYRNSIKESISAVESAVKVLSGRDSIAGGLEVLKKKIEIHQDLERTFKHIYNYTSDSDGIRHALMDSPNCDLEDARYMLISCSAFINYLIVKADKAGIKMK